MWTLQWCQNECDGVSNHQHIDCLLNRSFRRRSKKTSKLRITGFLRGYHLWTVNSPHKWSKANGISEMMPYMQNPINLIKIVISYLQLCLNKLVPSLCVCKLTVAIFKFMSKKCLLYSDVQSLTDLTNNLHLLFFSLSNAKFSFKKMHSNMWSVKSQFFGSGLCMPIDGPLFFGDTVLVTMLPSMGTTPTTMFDLFFPMFIWPSRLMSTFQWHYEIMLNGQRDLLEKSLVMSCVHRNYPWVV